MCSGKTNLLVAMARSLEIPARYMVIKIESEATLWKWIANQDTELPRQIGEPATEQDHVLAEIYIHSWETYDTSRDFAFEEGLRRLGISLERKLVSQTTGNSPIVLASFDEWAQNRQRVRLFRENRQEIFSRINGEIEKIRYLGRG